MGKYSSDEDRRRSRRYREQRRRRSRSRSRSRSLDRRREERRRRSRSRDNRRRRSRDRHEKRSSKHRRQRRSSSKSRRGRHHSSWSQSRSQSRSRSRKYRSRSSSYNRRKSRDRSFSSSSRTSSSSRSPSRRKDFRKDNVKKVVLGAQDLSSHIPNADTLAKIESDGFAPEAFVSRNSKTNGNGESSLNVHERNHEDAMFGTNDCRVLNSTVEIKNVVHAQSSGKEGAVMASLLHEREDVKNDRWIKKLQSMREKKLSNT